MEKLSEKYENFKAFIKEVVPASPTLFVFMESSLDLFLKTLYQRSVEEKLTNKKMLNMILDKLDLRGHPFKEEDLEKFGKYIQYFTKASILIYG